MKTDELTRRIADLSPERRALLEQIAKLVHPDEKDYIFLLTMHNIATNGRSMGVLRQKLSACP